MKKLCLRPNAGETGSKGLIVVEASQSLLCKNPSACRAEFGKLACVTLRKGQLCLRPRAAVFLGLEMCMTFMFDGKKVLEKVSIRWAVFAICDSFVIATVLG